LTAAERKLERNRRMIWQYRREVRADAREKRAALLFAGRQGKREEDEEQDTPPATDEPRKKTDMAVLQIAIVSIKNGQTSTFFSPPNDQVASWRDNTVDYALVMRRIRFDGEEIPAEYAWCAGELDEDGEVTVYHTLRTFILAVEREAALGGDVQLWPDLVAEDRHLIEQELKKI
jgi:hypothetical protein